MRLRIVALLLASFVVVLAHRGQPRARGGGIGGQQGLPVPHALIVPGSGAAGTAPYVLHDRNVAIGFADGRVIVNANRGSRGHALFCEFVGAANARPVGEGERSVPVNRYTSSRRTRSHAMERVVYRDAWPGIDVVWEPRRQGLEYTLVVHPGADVSQARLKWNGADDVREVDGCRELETPLGTLRESAPVAYQDGAVVPCAFRAEPDGSYGFHVGSYDPARTLGLIRRSTILHSSEPFTRYAAPHKSQR